MSGTDSAVTEATPKLDVLFEGIKKYEDAIWERKDKARKARAEITRYRLDTKNLNEQSQQLEDEFRAAEQQADSLESNLNEMKRGYEGLTAGLQETYDRLLKQREIIEAAEERVDTLTDDLVMAASNFAWRHRLDNPELLKKYSAMQQEKQELEVEETRLLADIKLHEDMKGEIDPLVDEMNAVDSEKDEKENILHEKKKEVEKSRQQLENAKRDKNCLMDPAGDVRIQRARWDLKNAIEEGEALQTALAAMKLEHRQVTMRLREKRANTPGNMPTTQRGPSSSEYKKNISIGTSKPNETRTRLPANDQFGSSKITMSNKAGDLTENNTNNEWETTSSGAPEERSSLYTDCSAGKKVHNSSPKGKPSSYHHDKSWICGNNEELISSTSGVGPSTPCTFTRNKPPPTPQLQYDSQEESNIGCDENSGSSLGPEQNTCNRNISSAWFAPGQGNTQPKAWGAASTSQQKPYTYSRPSHWSSNSSQNQPQNEQGQTRGHQYRGGKIHFKYQKRTVVHMNNTGYERTRGRRPNRCYNFWRGQGRYQNFRGGRKSFAREDASDKPKDHFDSSFSWNDLKDLEQSSANEASATKDPFDTSFSWDDLKGLEQSSATEVPATKDPFDSSFSWKDLKDLEQSSTTEAPATKDPFDSSFSWDDLKNLDDTSVGGDPASDLSEVIQISNISSVKKC